MDNDKPVQTPRSQVDILKRQRESRGRPRRGAAALARRKIESDAATVAVTSGKRVVQIGSTSIIPLAGNHDGHIRLTLDDDSDRDEADASDTDMVTEGENGGVSLGDSGQSTPARRRSPSPRRKGAPDKEEKMDQESKERPPIEGEEEKAEGESKVGDVKSESKMEEHLKLKDEEDEIGQIDGQKKVEINGSRQSETGDGNTVQGEKVKNEEDSEAEGKLLKPKNGTLKEESIPIKQ